MSDWTVVYILLTGFVSIALLLLWLQRIKRVKAFNKDHVLIPRHPIPRDPNDDYMSILLKDGEIIRWQGVTVHLRNGRD